MEAFSPKGFEKMWPTMPKEMMETVLGNKVNENGLDAKTRLMLTLAGLTMQGAQNEMAVRQTVRHLLEAGRHEAADRRDHRHDGDVRGPAGHDPRDGIASDVLTKTRKDEDMTVFAFYLFAICVIAGGLFTVISRNPVHSVLWLILAFLCSAGLFVLLGAEFVAMLLIIVYVGAVAVLFLFVVMMLDVDFAELKAEMAKYMPLALLIGRGHPDAVRHGLRRLGDATQAAEGLRAQVTPVDRHNTAGAGHDPL